MVKKFLTQLTQVTDFFIIIATVFVVLAFLTPAEKSFQSLIDETETKLYSSINNRSEVLSLLQSLRQQETSLNIELNTILNTVPDTFDEDNSIETIVVESIPIDTSSIEATINLTLRQISSSIVNLEELEDSISLSEKRLEDLKLQSNSTKSISWLQPIRKNTMILIDAGGIDGLIAGFASLIFCLVYKRRKDWFSNVFRIRLK